MEVVAPEEIPVSFEGASCPQDRAGHGRQD